MPIIRHSKFKKSRIHPSSSSSSSLRAYDPSRQLARRQLSLKTHWHTNRSLRTRSSDVPARRDDGPGGSDRRRESHRSIPHPPVVVVVTSKRRRRNERQHEWEHVQRLVVRAFRDERYGYIYRVRAMEEDAKRVGCGGGGERCAMLVYVDRLRG